MTPVVVDASALVEYLRAPARHPVVEATLTGEQSVAIAPHVCDLEMASALRKHVQRGMADLQHALRLLSLYRALPIERFDHLPLLGRIFELRENFSPYDAAYVALAEALEAPLLTADARLAAAVRRFTGVEILEA